MNEIADYLRKLQKELKTRVYLQLLSTCTGSVHYMKDDSILFVFGNSEEFYFEAKKILNEATVSEVKVCPDCGYEYQDTHDEGWHNKMMHHKDWQT